jgi:sec-independent protein translocase protein TatC
MSYDPESESVEQPFMTHLIELRDRLLRIVAAVLVIFLCLFPFANDLYAIVSAPLLEVMPAGTSMIATEVASPFLTPFKLALVLAIFAAMPFILYQIWSFIAPALYTHERKLIFPLMASSTILFYLGMAFAYYVVFPLVFAFFTSTTPDGVAVMTDIARYLDFVLKLFFAFGVAFEVPIAVILLIWAGMTTVESLSEKRPYIIVGAFVIGMLLTPPDVISQTLLALPMWFLFEVGLIASKYFVSVSKEGEAARNAMDQEEDEDDPETEQDMDELLDRYERDEAALGDNSYDYDDELEDGDDYNDDETRNNEFKGKEEYGP